MTGWHYIADDLTDEWVSLWLCELLAWPARLEEWVRAQGVVAPDDVELTSDPGA